MGLFRSLKGTHPDTVDGPSSQPESLTDPPEKHFHRSTSSHQTYAGSRGLPRSDAYQQLPPEALPQGSTGYSASTSELVEHHADQPHHGPPSSLGEPPPYHDWTIIPDTSTLPPPPIQGHEQPAKNNADANEADRAHDWCKINPLVFPHQPTLAQTTAVSNGEIRLIKPQEYKGDLLMPSVGSWKGSTKARMKDACLVTSLPLYFASADSPVHTGHSKTMYFEVEIQSVDYIGRNDESTIALGFCAMPYPTWRLPGWERASLGVHSDDGRRYVNDPWGGKDFTSPFGTSDTVGIGMTFSVPENPPNYNVEPAQPLLKNKVEIFFTRNGRKDGVWDLAEELDHNLDQGIEGLDGLFDLYGAIGTFGRVNFAIKFRREEWLWRPQRS